MTTEEDTLEAIRKRDEEIRELRGEHEQAVERGRPKPIANLVLAFPPPSRLLNDEQARARDQRAAIASGRELRLEHVRRSGIARHLGIGDASRLVRDELSSTPALGLVQGWAKPERDTARRWMLIGGTRGVGKTVAAGWLIARDGGRYLTMLDLVQAFAPVLRGMAPQTQDEIGERLAAIARVEVLVLDELGRDGFSPEVAREALHWLVEARQSAKRGRTLVLSNLSAVDIRKRFNDGTYDSRTESRLRPLLARRQDGAGIFEVVGEDLRGAPV